MQKLPDPNTTDPFHRIAWKYTELPDVQRIMGVETGAEIDVVFLAQGEYNANFIFESGVKKAVLRINAGSQMHLENQIRYEFQTLQLLEKTGVTPKPLFCDDTFSISQQGVLLMEFIPGRWMQYADEYLLAADLFAKIHRIQYHPSTGLISTPRPAFAILDDCRAMVNVYLESSLGSRRLKRLLERVFDRVRQIVESFDESFPLEKLVLTNTEVNSSNFLYDEKTGSLRLVDWEKAVFSIPAQDLSHFLVPTVTLWKTDYRFSREEIGRFIQRYCDQTDQKPGVIKAQMDVFWPVTCLRGVSWCAMAFVEYQQDDKLLMNDFAWDKIQSYLQESFILEVFKDILDR